MRPRVEWDHLDIVQLPRWNYACTLSCSQKNIRFTRLSRFRRFSISLAHISPPCLLSFYTRFSRAFSVADSHAGLWRMVSFVFHLGHWFSGHPPGHSLCLFFSFFYISLSLSRAFSSTFSPWSSFHTTRFSLLSPLTLSRLLSTSSLRFMFTLTHADNMKIEKVDSANDSLSPSVCYTAVYR